MQVKRAELLNQFEAVLPGLAKKEVIEQSQCFIFKDGSLFTYNDEIRVQHPTPLKISGAVSAEEVYKLLSMMKDEDIEVDVSDKELLVSGKKVKSGVRLDAEITLPVQEFKVPSKWEEMPKSFAAAVKFCSFSVAKDMTRPILTCINFKEGKATSSDRFRITQYKLPNSFVTEVSLPAKSCEEIIKRSPTHYSIGKAWAHFKTAGGAILSCRTYSEPYPDVSKFMKVTGQQVELPKSLPNMVKRAMIFTTAKFEQDNYVTLKLSEGRLFVKGQGEAGWLSEKSKVNYSGPDFSIILHPGFLLDAITFVDKVIFGERAVMFHSEQFSHVVAALIPNQKKD